MYFKRIEIQGFKSFAEPVSIEFHEGITCIVGPNGSGKSNISDAIRWVLGEQSAKMLRGGKMEEVIFAGTASRKSRGMAEVTLVIDNHSHILPIDYSEVAITRRMYRSGESGYFINKVPCRLRDIRELIMDTGIGVDGYSIIGQGRISDILSEKPEARREIFEEAAGIVKYRSKKEESERKLEASKANLDRVDDIVGEIESRIDGLKEESVKAAEYIKLRDRYKDIEINITLKNVESLELKNEYIKDDITELDNSLEESTNQKAATDEDLAANEIRNEELETFANGSRDKLMLLVGEINDLTGRSRLNLEKRSSIERDKERINREIESLILRREREEGNGGEVSANLEKIRLEYETLKGSFDVKNREAELLEKEVKDLQAALDNHKHSIYETYSLTAGKKSEISSLLSLKDTLTKRKNQIEAEGEDQNTYRIDFEDRHRIARDERDEAVGALEDIKRVNSSLKESYLKRLEKERAAAHELGEKKISAGQLTARLNLIQEMEAAYEGYNEAVKFIMRSGTEGLHGAVADLIKVPSGFEKAVETALGPALQNIVCGNDRDAQKAIGLLKANKAGRLTFLPLSGIKASQRPRGNIANEGGVKGFGVDCIEFDSKYKSVMEYLLGRVVIVERLEDAIRLSKGQEIGGLRFVSLEGDVVNASGAITGGSFRSKTAGLLERKAEAKVLSEKIGVLNGEQRQLAAELDELRTALESEKARIEAGGEKQKETELALLSKENELIRIAAGLKDIENLGGKRQRELSSIKSEEESAEAMISKLKASIAKEEAFIEEAEKNAQGALKQIELKSLDLDKAREELTEIRLLTGAASNEKNNAEQTLKRTEEYIEEYKAEITSKEESLKTLEREKEALFSDDGDSSKLLAEKEDQKADIEEKLRKAIDEKSLITRYLIEIRKKRENLNEIISGWQTDKHELELKLAKNETQVEGYKEKLWEDFEISYIQAMEFQKKDFAVGAAVRESREIKNRMKEIGEVNLGSIKEYESVKERYEFLTVQREDLISAMDSLVQIIEDMDRNIKRSFKESFDQVVINFENTFQALFGGGSAELRLADESKPLETGIDIIVQPPGKKLQNISLLSGGEKTLTAIALMFAILKTKPTPFCILDEVEAALDEANIDRFAKYLQDFREIQFTLVTHQKATMEYADVLYGVTMPEGGISKVISLKLGDEIEL
ncbi:chromosome segregation protein SMC [Bacillota bacterium]